MPIKIALLGIFHESNTFLDKPTTLSDFRKGHWLTGPEILKEYAEAHHEIGGMLEVLDQENIEVVPVMYAEATPGGIISSETYESLLQQMMQELEKVLPVDGFLVTPHGAAVSETFRDMDGHWLSLLRKKAGKDKPIVGTLDPHANVSRLMVSSTDALIAYKTNPHIDQRQTGRLAAGLLLELLRGNIMPQQILVEVPLAISIEQQYTGNDPCKSLYAYAHQLSQQEGILSVSILFGFPYADVREMGSSVIVVSDNRRDLALSVGKQLENYMISHREHFIGSKRGISSSLSLLKDSKKPVLMLDMGDNVGGGAPGDSAFLLDALEQHGKYKYFICLYDPQAVLQAEKYKTGDSFDIPVVVSNPDAITKVIRITLLRLADGKFKETSPRHGGQVNYDMGNTAIVSTIKGSIIMLTSLRVPPFSLQQLTAFDIIPGDFDILIAKGVNAPIAAYGPVCPTIMQMNTPGVTQADMTLFKYHNRRKPLFPFERL